MATYIQHVDEMNRHRQAISDHRYDYPKLVSCSKAVVCMVRLIVDRLHFAQPHTGPCLRLTFRTRIEWFHTKNDKVVLLHCLLVREKHMNSLLHCPLDADVNGVRFSLVVHDPGGTM
jgi:hypothetical protein